MPTFSPQFLTQSSENRIWWNFRIQRISGNINTTQANRNRATRNTENESPSSLEPWNCVAAAQRKMNRGPKGSTVFSYFKSEERNASASRNETKGERGVQKKSYCRIGWVGKAEGFCEEGRSGVERLKEPPRKAKSKGICNFITRPIPRESIKNGDVYG